MEARLTKRVSNRYAHLRLATPLQQHRCEELLIALGVLDACRIHEFMLLLSHDQP